MLVNEWTNSAGEMAAQFAKDTKLATIVGKQTRGNVLGSTMFNVGNGYQLYLPIFGWYSPSGTYTEGNIAMTSSETLWNGKFVSCLSRPALQARESPL